MDGLEGLTIEAREIGGDVVGEPEPTIEEAEHLVIRWNDDEVVYPYVGLVVTGYGNLSTAASSPYIVEHDPADVERVLFGPGVTVEEETEEGVTMETSSPFGSLGLSDQEGPYVDLPLP